MVASQNLIGRLVDPPIALAALRLPLQETGVWLAHLGAVLLDLALLVIVRLPGLETADHAGRGAAGVDNRLVGDGKHLDQPGVRGKKSNPGTDLGRNQDLVIGFGDV